MLAVQNWATQQGIQITAPQVEKLAAHRHMVLEKNKVMNLTAITCSTAFETKHIIDSLSVLPFIPHGAQLADIGTGAGFPGIVIAIMRPDVQVTLVDSLRKRVIFLQEVVEAISLPNVTAIHARAEDMARQGHSFDICTARAVAHMQKLAKWVLPLTKRGGTFLAMKGPAIQEELETATPTITKLGARITAVHAVTLQPGLVHSIVEVLRA